MLATDVSYYIVSIYTAMKLFLQQFMIMSIYLWLYLPLHISDKYTKRMLQLLYHLGDMHTKRKLIQIVYTYTNLVIATPNKYEIIYRIVGIYCEKKYLRIQQFCSQKKYLRFLILIYS